MPPEDTHFKLAIFCHFPVVIVVGFLFGGGNGGPTLRVCACMHAYTELMNMRNHRRTSVKYRNHNFHRASGEPRPYEFTADVVVACLRSGHETISIQTRGGVHESLPLTENLFAVDSP